MVTSFNWGPYLDESLRKAAERLREKYKDYKDYKEEGGQEPYNIPYEQLQKLVDNVRVDKPAIAVIGPYLIQLSATIIKDAPNTKALSIPSRSIPPEAVASEAASPKRARKPRARKKPRR